MIIKKIKAGQIDIRATELFAKLIPDITSSGSFYDSIPNYPSQNNPITTMPNQMLLAETKKYEKESDTYGRLASEKTVINGNIAEYFLTEYSSKGAQNILESEDNDVKIIRSFNLMIDLEDVPDHTSSMNMYGIEDMNIGTIHIPQFHFKEASTYASGVSEEGNIDRGFLIDDTKRFESLAAPKIGDLIKIRLDGILYKIVYVDDGAFEEGDFLSRQVYWTCSIKKYIDNHQSISDENGMKNTIEQEIGDKVNQEKLDDIFNISEYIKDRRDTIIYDDKDEHIKPKHNTNTVGEWFR